MLNTMFGIFDHLTGTFKLNDAAIHCVSYLDPYRTNSLDGLSQFIKLKLDTILLLKLDLINEVPGTHF